MSSIIGFFGPSRVYAVLGASSNPNKFGYTVLEWYKQRSLPVIPVNPKTKEILNIPTAQDILSAYKIANETYPKNDGISISFITPPAVTKSVLELIKQNGIENKIGGVWFQPGAYDSDCVKLSKELGIKSVVENGDCILVIGDQYLVKSKL